MFSQLWTGVLVMASRSTIRSAVHDARQRLAEGLAAQRALHDAGTSGVEVCLGLTQLIDETLLGLFHHALRDIEQPTAPSLRSRVALVALGGYGRRELAPFSDVDVMLLYYPGDAQRVAPLAERLLRDGFDAGLKLGHSVRTPNEALSLAKQDPQIFTALTESRLLLGGEELFQQFWVPFRDQATRRRRSQVQAIAAARKEERLQFGETSYLLEPNVKRSHGGLRAVQLLRWVAFCHYRTTDPIAIQQAGGFSLDELQRLLEAQEYLLRLRNELHFHAGKNQDLLGRAEQVRLAERYGYQDQEGLRAVEQFMQEYFRRTSDVRYIVSRFVANMRDRSKLGKTVGYLLSQPIDGDFLVGPRRISATARGLRKLQTDLTEVLRLCDLSNLCDKRIAHDTWEAVREAAPDLPETVSRETAARFLSLLDQPGRLAELLRQLHELGVLEKLVPAFARARGLLQFNEYHKYTVDEHCIRAVGEAEKFFLDAGPLGEVYRKIRHKRILHLALLIHDLGKGRPEDHSEVGLRIATRVAERLFLSDREKRMLETLVHQHLLMAHLALRRDAHDPATLLQLAVAVGSPQTLHMLYVLTAADFAAVGPGVLNDWKVELLTQLHDQTLEHLSGDESSRGLHARMETQRRLLHEQLERDKPAEWFRKQVAALPSALLVVHTPEHLAGELRALQRMKPGEVYAAGRYLEDRSAVEYTIGAHESIASGIFYRLTGAISSAGHDILSAEIHTLQEGLVLDRFHVHDHDFTGAPPPERLADVERRLRAALLDPAGRPRFRRLWRPTNRASTSDLAPLPIRVRIDNSTSDFFTILDIFAPDETGLLYVIAKTLYKLELSVRLAKIGTYLDQVVDVFYVVDRDNGKIQDEARLEKIRHDLIAAIEHHETTQRRRK